MKLLESYSFQFPAQELSQQLRQFSQEPLTGYWRFEFPSFSGTGGQNSWYLGLLRGQIVFSGNQPLSWQALLRIFQRYVPRLQSTDARAVLSALEQRLLPQSQTVQSVLLAQLLQALEQLNSLTMEQLIAALRLHILSDFDTYLFKYSGQAQFLPCALDMPTPLFGFELEDLLAQAQQRQFYWHQLQATIPSLDSVPVLNREVVQSAHLTPQQKLWLEHLTSKGHTLKEIAVGLAQDSLEVTKIFARLLGNNLVTFKSSTNASLPEVFMVDDSPLILKQFESLVSSWGYAVRSFQSPTSLLQVITHSHPAAFFLDINMPGITGFDLVKQIRRQPQLTSVPIIMLTAEQTLTNNWRARWSGCQFLSKPLAPNDVSRFKQELRLLLSELLLR